MGKLMHECELDNTVRFFSSFPDKMAREKLYKYSSSAGKLCRELHSVPPVKYVFYPIVCVLCIANGNTCKTLMRYACTQLKRIIGISSYTPNIQCISEEKHCTEQGSWQISQTFSGRPFSSYILFFFYYYMHAVACTCAASMRILFTITCVCVYVVPMDGVFPFFTLLRLMRMLRLGNFL